MTTINCECCWITLVELSLKNDDHFCQSCRGHKFGIVNLRADHQRMNATLLANHSAAIASSTREIEQIDARLTTMRAERDDLVRTIVAGLNDAPDGVLLDKVRDAAVTDLQEKLRSSYYSRDRAMGAVWVIDEMHHAVASGEKCSCSKAVGACREYKALEFFRADFERWERKQIELMKAGKHHGLPANHPESRKVFTDWYFWKGTPSTQPEQQSRRAG